MIPTALAVAGSRGIYQEDMNTNVKPGDDFYEYAGGGWMKSHPLTAEYSSYGVFNDLAEKNRLQLQELFDNLQKEKHEFGSVGQKVTDLYNLAMDSVRLNSEGSAPLRADLDALKAFKKKDLTPFIVNQHLTLGNPFFGIGVMADLANSSMNVTYMDAGTSGMPDRDYYLKTNKEARANQAAYRAMLQKLFTLCGYTKKEAQRMTKTIYDIEYQFAEASMTRAEMRDYVKLYNVYTIERLQAEYPAINWRQYFDMMGLTEVTQVILEQPKVMDVANRLMTQLTEQQIRDYVAGGIITAATGYLSDEIAETSFDFYGRRLSGQQERKPRWKRAQGFPNSLLGMAVGQLYVEKYFPEASKQKMQKLIQNLRKSLAQHIAALDWMSDQTKINALMKLNAFTVKVGYPDKWRDYTELVINPQKSLYENIKAATIYETQRNLKKNGKPVDRDEWGMTPQTINAYYSPLNNEIVFPAAILQAPFFNPDADDAVNYGAIGVVIGHEMTHGFDDQGATFDADGNMADWWTAEDKQNFQKATEQLAGQFDQIVVAKGEHANGRLTLGENIADQGGLRIAYDAFMNTDEARSGQPIDGFTPEQRFYLSYGRIWAENITEDAAYMQTKTDPHSLGRWRVNATLRNIDTFFKAFGIQEGDPMWLAPEDRVIIW
ncbi:MAG: M13 family metallopeptidase [Paludibacteraceae bacterium]|nr:M13 family metallopeptidase [Paludibacteraceae bacterium]